MAYQNIKAEHAGAKKGNGAYCRKAEAKKGAKKIRRANDKSACRES